MGLKWNPALGRLNAACDLALKNQPNCSTVCELCRTWFYCLNTEYKNVVSSIFLVLKTSIGSVATVHLACIITSEGNSRGTY